MDNIYESRDVTAAELTEIISNKGARTVSTLRREGVNNAISTAAANPDLFVIRDGLGSPVIGINKTPTPNKLSFGHGVAVGMVGMTVVFIFILIVLFSNKNVF